MPFLLQNSKRGYSHIDEEQKEDDGATIVSPDRLGRLPLGVRLVVCGLALAAVAGALGFWSGRHYSRFEGRMQPQTLRHSDNRLTPTQTDIYRVLSITIERSYTHHRMRQMGHGTPFIPVNNI